MQEMTKDEQIAVMQAKIRQTILENKNKAPNALIFGVVACNI